jgi:adenosylmethionine-8-amino-7-oxononanoate aminotransferase
VLLAPPYIISEEQAGEIVERLAHSIEAVLGR